ncbi:hypothetical protein A4H97_11655 [Niastella yeongjuensis]|uniref:Uncharacterized protein n=1 Tax=Niastella yeongjuensis TaxID=354355 RepID=A0A1V9E9P0_9BACT|nr:hypothetical protein [Niastella yeongjuensis]OQP42809.1 hypothetical protein A4H97_11655 [Niastella yeongjuensis]SEO54985.1 hypothetical protein SAMN05660816_02998 [Niastella yeongjuensis]
MKKRLIIQLHKAVTAAFIFSFIFISCDKDNDNGPAPEKPLEVEEAPTAGNSAQPVITITGNTTVPPSKTKYNFVFDWENTQFMPVVPGHPAVPVPWSDQTIRNYDPGLRYDYKKSDGWELVYNSFSDTLDAADPFFILYNKYRGVIRYYTYNVRESNPTVANYRSIVNIMSVNGEVNGMTHMLNFADQLIVDMNVNSDRAVLMEPWPFTQNAWYLSQYEIAYDGNLHDLTWDKFLLGWSFNFVRPLELSLNNKPAGNKMLFLQSPGFNFLFNLGTTIGTNMQAHIKSVGGLDELSGIFSGSVVSNLKQTIFDSTAGNKLNATLVPQLNMADTKVDVPALIRLYPDGVGYIRLNLASPGFDHSNVIGFGPSFNEPLGIFYLGAAPVINHTKVDGPLSEQYTLDVASIEYKINPFTQAYATIRNFRQEIVAVATNETPNLTEAHLYQGQQLKASAPLNILGVRVSLEVVPKNGSAPVKIIKTFKADLRNS